jgi:hypothetical protein
MRTLTVIPRQSNSISLMNYAYLMLGRRDEALHMFNHLLLLRYDFGLPSTNRVQVPSTAL